jgi:hypothetical protein
MKYKNKPVVIEAIRYTGENACELHQFFTNLTDIDVDNGHVKIKTLEGDMLVSAGDYVIKGVKGEFYPCKPDIFEMTYEAVIDE